MNAERAARLDRIAADAGLRASLQAKVRANVAISATGCWLWQRATNGTQGYGLIYIGAGHTALAHRVAYVVFIGPIPTGLIVRHHCDVPTCCNPAHLGLGTFRDNARDAIERGRQSRGDKHAAAMQGKARRGQRHYRVTLTDGEVAYARRLRGAGLPIKTIARELGIKERTAGALIAGNSRAGAQRPAWSLPGDAFAIARMRKMNAGLLQHVEPLQRAQIESAGRAALTRREMRHD